MGNCIIARNGGGMETYSTNEERIGTWTNGKPLYRKMIVNGATYNSGTTTIENLNLSDKYIAKVQGTARHVNGNQWSCYTVPSQSANIFMLYTGSQTNLVMSFSDSVTDVFIWVEYTKTTD